MKLLSLKSLALLFILLFSIHSIAQERLKKQKVWTSKYEYETYWATKSNPKFKQGEYHFYKDSYLRVHGFYKDNRKDSLWTEYDIYDRKLKEGRCLNDQKVGIWHEFTYPNGRFNYKYKVSKGKYEFNKRDSLWISYNFDNNKNKHIRSSEGYYENGLREGNFVNYDTSGLYPLAVGKYRNDCRINKWIFYYKGQILQVYDFDKNTMMYQDTGTVVANARIVDGKYKDMIYLDISPEFKSESYLEFFNSNLIYPDRAKNYRVQGTVFVSFIVNLDGSISEVKILKGIGAGCDKETLRFIYLSNGKWKPGVFNNEDVVSRMILPIGFRLEY